MGLQMKALKKMCQSDTQELILDKLKNTNYSTRVTKRELCDITHLGSREVRETIQKMRANGIPIASDMDIAGYFLPRSWEQYKTFAKKYVGRAETIYKIQSKMYRTAEAMFSGQIRMTSKDGEI